MRPQGAREADQAETAERQLAERGLWSHSREDGLLRLVALLPPEEGALVLAAVEAVAGQRPPMPIDGAPAPDPANDRWTARRADALVRSRRLVSERLRRALQARDRGCRFPGCPLRVPRTPYSGVPMETPNDAAAHSPGNAGGPAP